MFVILDSEAAVTLASDEAFWIGCRPAPDTAGYKILKKKIGRKKLEKDIEIGCRDSWIQICKKNIKY